MGGLNKQQTAVVAEAGADGVPCFFSVFLKVGISCGTSKLNEFEERSRRTGNVEPGKRLTRKEKTKYEYLNTYKQNILIYLSLL